MSEKKQQGISTGAGILVAGVLIAGAILFTGLGGSSNDQPLAAGGEAAPLDINTKLNKGDHIYGDPKAEITIIEYSDFECPFCARFHPTMETIVANNENVKWVYRHFPISSHKNAKPAAIASECIADLGGNDMFWDFSAHIFENLGDINPARYLAFAEENGIDKDDFEACLIDPATEKKVDNDTLDGQESGARGTPYSVLVTPKGEAVPFSGALPIETVQALIDQVNAGK
ncbi:MAG: protein-disulfide isomerase [Candidatus Paceibacteria bacterium]|jgi:protein-disulfide isomerase